MSSQFISESQGICHPQSGQKPEYLQGRGSIYIYIYIESSGLLMNYLLGAVAGGGLTIYIYIYICIYIIYIYI